MIDNKEGLDEGRVMDLSDESLQITRRVAEIGEMRNSWCKRITHCSVQSTKL